MNEREKTIRLWFDMWLNQQDMGIDDIFTEDVIYTESWSPQYNNRKTVKHWFQEWNTRGKVCLLYTSPSPRDRQKSRMPSSA